MGICWNCENDVFLKDEEVRCDKCKEVVRYWCNSCTQPFDVQNKNSKKVAECKWCYYFKCPNCNACGENCQSNEHIIFIEKQLRMVVPVDKFYEIKKISKKILDYFEDVKNGKEKTTCEFGVPKTYAKERIKGVLARMKGFRVRDFQDQKAFETKQEEVLDEEEEHEFTIGNTRTDGSYGQEYRDVFNLCVCMGTLKHEKKKFKNEKGIEIGYDSWTRIEETQCPYLDTKELIVKICPRCKKVFNRVVKYCDICSYKKGGKKHPKDTFVELHEKLSNVPTCKNLSNFRKRGEDGESKFEEEA